MESLVYHTTVMDKRVRYIHENDLRRKARAIYENSEHYRWLEKHC
jgi:hypothetical protein